jgi:hypothetical protein
VTRFRADVLATNDRMLRLVGTVGRIDERSLDRGVVSLRFTRRPAGEPEPAGTPPGEVRS